MKRVYFVLLALFILMSGLQAQDSFSVTVIIKRIQNVQAPLIIGLYNNEESFKTKKALDSIHVVPSKETVTVMFKKVPAGNYAIALFQDVHKTGKLTTREFGIPTEPVGVSNYPLPGIPQPPKFKKAVFTVNKDMEITIPLMFAKDYKKDIEKLE